MTADFKTASMRSIRSNQIAGVLLVLFLVGGLTGWATVTEISGAVIAQGALVVDSDLKKVQHPNGGVVGQIFARDGDRVNAGDIVLRLDDTIMTASLGIVTKTITELTARKARLEAERDAAERLTIPRELSNRIDTDEDAEHAMAGEQRLFDLRKEAREGLRLRLHQRLEQLNQEVVGLREQSDAKAREVELIARELESARELWAKNLMPISKMTNIEREATRVSGEKGQLTSEIAKSKAKISETQLEVIQIDRDLASEVARELREVDGKIGEFAERKIAAEDQLRRVVIRAPQSGIVHQSTVHTVGGVINAGEPIMLIVPDADKLTVEAKVAPQDIDQVHEGQQATLRFTAFNARTTPEVAATLTRISADVSKDEKTGSTYYTVRVTPVADDVAQLGSTILVPGMPAEVFIRTEQRKVISYLVKPLTDQIARAFCED